MMNIMMKIMISYDPKSHRSWGVQSSPPRGIGSQRSTEPLHHEDLNKPPQKRSWSHWLWLRWYLRSPPLPQSQGSCFQWFKNCETEQMVQCYGSSYLYVCLYIFFTRLHLSTTNCKSAYLLYCLCICTLYTCSSVSLYPSPSMTKYNAFSKGKSKGHNNKTNNNQMLNHGNSCTTQRTRLENSQTSLVTASNVRAFQAW